jgi:hypothetical protein
MKTRIVASLSFVAILTGCTAVPLEDGSQPRNYRDQTITQPHMYFEETPQSKSVIVGSAQFAKANGCAFISRYRIRTNTDFTSSVNMFRYRANLMGAKWVTILQHGEVDRSEGAYQMADGGVVLREGKDMGSSRFFTTIVGDLYDCPCSATSCSAR